MPRVTRIFVEAVWVVRMQLKAGVKGMYLQPRPFIAALLVYEFLSFANNYALFCIPILSSSLSVSTVQILTYTLPVCICVQCD